MREDWRKEGSGEACYQKTMFRCVIKPANTVPKVWDTQHSGASGRPPEECAREALWVWVKSTDLGVSGCRFEPRLPDLLSDLE